jgi:hypothetical protein
MRNGRVRGGSRYGERFIPINPPPPDAEFRDEFAGDAMNLRAFPVKRRLEGKLSNEVTVRCWRDEKPGIHAQGSEGIA